MSDNTYFDLIDCDLDLSLKIAFRGRKAYGFHENGTELILFWTDGEGITPFPTPLNAEEVKPIVVGWLKNTAQYTPEPDHDGHNTKSWRGPCDEADVLWWELESELENG